MRTVERLTIKSFAGIESISIDIARITTLIGPQASGKSVTAKLLYFFRGIWQNLFYNLDIDIDSESRKNFVKEQFRRYFPTETWGKEVFTLQYEFGEHKVLLRRAPSRGRPSDGLIMFLPSFTDEIFQNINQYILESTSKARSSNLSYRHYEAWRRIEPELKSAIGVFYYSSQLFVPAGRAFFSNVENNVFSFISRSEKRLDPFLTEFGEFFSIVKSGGIRRIQRKEFSKPLAKGLLGGTLVIETDKEFVKTDDGRSLLLSNLSSGQQEALPLLLMLENTEEDISFSSGTDEHRHASYIEEPEAHLFPDFQRKVTERIVEYALSPTGAQSLFITTHSPYVLATLNVLLLAGKIGGQGSKAKRRGVAEIVPTSQWLTVDQVAAYSFTKEGCSTILDMDSGLIDANYLDAVSTAISKRFDSLLEIEYPNSEVTLG